jgi:ligand-binding SRPBCC domain-containing protein
LRRFRQSFIVQSSIERVWHFYTDVRHLEIITPKQMDLKIISTTSQNIVQGQEIWVSGKIFEAMKIRRAFTWHSKITFLKEYEYIDEMLEGPFKKWRHLHQFHIVDGKQRDNR